MAENATALFQQMEMLGIVPDNKTFVALLTACNPDGLVDEGWKYFNPHDLHLEDLRNKILNNLYYELCIIDSTDGLRKIKVNARSNENLLGASSAGPGAVGLKSPKPSGGQLVVDCLEPTVNSPEI
ncbi:hypothetical protein LguiA_004676 [Lonicera macranthoides]